jgi:hypothetical protein
VTNDERGPGFLVALNIIASAPFVTRLSSPGYITPRCSAVAGQVSTTYRLPPAVMGFDQYHEPPNELSEKTRTFARMLTSMIEEAEAIGWYEQRLSLEKDRDARAIMKNAQHEEMKHFGMDLEFLLRKKAEWREILKGILFKKGDIVEHGDEAEEASE